MMLDEIELEPDAERTVIIDGRRHMRWGYDHANWRVAEMIRGARRSGFLLGLVTAAFVWSMFTIIRGALADG